VNETDTAVLADMDSGPKRKTGIGLADLTMQRVDRLRAVLGMSRTRIVEYLLTHGGLPEAETRWADGITRFNRLAHAADTDNGTWQEYADWYAMAFSSKTFPPDIEALEALARDAGAVAPGRR
jgi:hypothetical protein